MTVSTRQRPLHYQDITWHRIRSKTTALMFFPIRNVAMRGRPPARTTLTARAPRVKLSEQRSNASLPKRHDIVPVALTFCLRYMLIVVPCDVSTARNCASGDNAGCGSSSNPFPVPTQPLTHTFQKRMRHVLPNIIA
jgi:hypothetical protein